ncbi:M50 family metallopeptidase [Sporanaerobium hydrogeniformans]|uniref:M50 family metallopeptidase n=1 Tax=Sporanaerobium hydrogeniformans TaxID=3072179 RepID=UPI0015D49323|nr:site-2 protease family protein [Sporanaerobium hydrogeniformans]
MAKIIIILLMFNFIVVIHEWGHYITAKKNGVLVHEFAVGMGPRFWHFTKGETIYSLRIFPIGGFCSLEEELGDIPNPRAMGSKKAWQRLIIVSFGAIMNFLLAWLLFSIVSGYIGYGSNVIQSIEASMPADQAGLVKGDKILAIDGVKVKRLSDISAHLVDKEKTYQFTVKRTNSEVVEKEVTSKWIQEEGRARFGFTPEIVHWDLGYNMKMGLLNTFYVIKQVWSGVISLFTGAVSVDQMSGIVGVVDFSAKQWDTGIQNGGLSLAIMNMIYITALLSANLGVINLLPLPALDGGRILFILIELLRGKPLAVDKEAAVHFVGLVLLMLLTVVVLYNDIVKVFNI